MDDTNNNYRDVLLEQIRDQNQAVLEAVGEMQKHLAKLPHMEESIDELKQDMKVVKAAIIDISHQQRDHEQRLSRLEAA